MGKTSEYNHNNDIWIFLSHSTNDYEKVRVVRNILEEYNFRPLMFFLKCLNDDDEIDGLIKREIDSRTRFILCDSENARKSNWVKREVDYIKEQQRTFYTLDVSKSKEELKKDIKALYSNSHIFLSYSRNFHELAEELYERLNKYEYNVFMDITTLTSGACFMDVISKGIENAKRNGLFVSLVSYNTLLPDKFTYQELQMAIEKGNRIVPVFMEKDLPETPLLARLKDMEYIDVSESDNKVQDAMKHILSITHQPGSLLAIAESFSKEKNRKDFEQEVNLCGQIVLEASEKQPSNYSLKFLQGKCYENGFGTPVDLKKAYQYYSEAYKKGGIESAKTSLERLGRKLGLEEKDRGLRASLGKFFNSILRK